MQFLCSKIYRYFIYMAFYLKLPERYNTQGQPSPQTPRPGVAPPRLPPTLPRRRTAQCRYNFELCTLSPPLLPFCRLAILQKPCYMPNTGRNAPKTRCFVLGIYFYTLAIERLKMPSLPLSRGTPKKAIKQT